MTYRSYIAKIQWSGEQPSWISVAESRQAGEAILGMRWWNGLSKAERVHWLDTAWRRKQSLAGRLSYSLEDMPSAADAWEAFKASAA